MCSTWRWGKGNRGRTLGVPLPTRLQKLRSKCHCVHIHTSVQVSACATVDVCNEVGVGVDIGHDLTSSILYFRKLLVWAHSQAERMRDTGEGREIYSPAVIMLLKTTSSHHVYLSHLCKPQTALCSKSHFSRADFSVCSIKFSLPLSQEQPL